MNDTDFQYLLQQKKQWIDDQLPAYIHRLSCPSVLKEAMLYSLQAGGKRIRPILLLTVMEAFGADSKIGIPVSCAIEMVHTYSLIHDDLPAMDDDDFRRGQATNHNVFGEATAILAGDGLLTYSFEVIGTAQELNISDATKSILLTKFAHAAGPEGMIAGQMADLQAEGRQLSVDQLEDVHLNKTGKILSFAVEAGALLADANAEQMLSLRKYSWHVGLAFQIRDDILDIEGDTFEMGKTSGSDVNRQKSTYPQILTLEGAKEKLSKHMNEARQCLRQANIHIDALERITEYVVQRNH